MHIDWLGLWRVPFLAFPARQVEGSVFLVLYSLAFILAIIGTRRSLAQASGRRWLGLAALFLLTLLLNNAVNWYYPIAHPPVPNRPQEASGLSDPLLGSVPVLLIGAWFGPGPAMLAGALGGLMRAAFIQGQINPIFDLAFFGLVAGFLLNQDYRGRLWRILRQPLAAGPLSAVLLWPLLLPAIYVHTPGDDPLYVLDFTWPLFRSGLLPVLAEGLLAGLVVQALYAALPELRPVKVARSSPPYDRSLNRRLLFTFVPIMLITITVLVYAVTTTAINAATEQATKQMARDTVSASYDIPFFFQTGQSLAGALADDERMRSADASVRQTRLAEGVRAGAFFDEMLLTDAAGQPLNIAPTNGQKQLTDQEKTLVARAVSSGAPGTSSVQRASGQPNVPMVSFVVPVEDRTQPGARAGALVGRARLNVNPTMARALAGLQKTLGTGEGFIVDERGRIVLSAPEHGDLLMTDWRLDESLPVYSELSGGKVYISPVADGTRRLLYVRPVTGHPWTAVVELPYAAVLGLAAQVSLPLVALLLIVLLISSAAVYLVSGLVTRPLRELSQAAGRIADGKLDMPVTVRGEDEVGQLGDAFEQMRASLKGRIEDLALLLQASQDVAASLDLERGLPPILESALSVSGARSARLLLLSDDGLPQALWRRGEMGGTITPLDRQVADMATHLEVPMLVESVARARGTLDLSLISPSIRAVAVLPVRRLAKTLGVLWLAYSEPHRFDTSERNVLATLAGQTAVLIENSRLFQAAESERQRLAAILTSTSDAVLVTGPDDRVRLINPAAEVAFGVRAVDVAGKKLTDCIPDPALIRLMTPTSDGGTEVGELELPDGRTLYGSAADITIGTGSSLGRVVVMRDITRFKELDTIKSEFVATVSHDLRSPLTYMRGYAAMLPMVGDLNAKQQDYVEKIQLGISQMTELIDDLLDLGRIEAGVGAQLVECVFADVVSEVVEELRGRAVMSGLDLKLEINSRRTVIGDPALLKRAAGNLVDNAIKYTQQGGTVTVALDERPGSLLTLRVSDTGIGIAPADQTHLFEKFYRVKRRDTLDIKGSGLGLAIVKSIAEWHGGRVWVDSQLGTGSTFYFGLPTQIDQPGSSLAAR